MASTPGRHGRARKAHQWCIHLVCGSPSSCSRQRYPSEQANHAAVAAALAITVTDHGTNRPAATIHRLNWRQGKKVSGTLLRKLSLDSSHRTHAVPVSSHSRIGSIHRTLHGREAVGAGATTLPCGLPLLASMVASLLLSFGRCRIQGAPGPGPLLLTAAETILEPASGSCSIKGQTRPVSRSARTKIPTWTSR
jgi:hypothetical protein